MGRRKELFEIDGIIAGVSEHIERLGYNRRTVYRMAHDRGVSTIEVIRSLKSKEPPYVPPDPFVKGNPWDIRGCQNLINAVFIVEFNDLVEVIEYYLDHPSDRNRTSIDYVENWFRDSLPNYYETSPEEIIKEAWRQAREKRRKKAVGGENNKKTTN